MKLLKCYLETTEVNTGLDKGCGNAQEAVRLETGVETWPERPSREGADELCCMAGIATGERTLKCTSACD